MNEDHFARYSAALAEYRQTQAALRKLKGPRGTEERKRLRQTRRDLVSGYTREILGRSLYAAVDSSEALTLFWFNHFNVYWRKELVGAALPDYVESAIRPHALGRFRDLLLAVITHPAMLVYLDNDHNVAGRINENLVRELLELHTLGVTGGYGQTDVGEVARVLTGLGLRPIRPGRMPKQLAGMVREHGEFMFDPRKHDFGEKRVLGVAIPGSGFSEIETLIDLLARHPSTARHIAGKLGTFLLGDDVPEAVVANAAGVFQRTDGDIRATVRNIVQARDRVAGGRTFKDPFRFVASAVRLLAMGEPLKDVRPLSRWLAALGQPLFGRRTPDGYSLSGRDWLSAGQLTQRFELAREMVAVVPRLLEKPVSAAQIRAAPATEALVATLGPKSRHALARATRDRDYLALLLSSPEFMYW